MTSDFKEFAINVLGYRDDDGWIALAIDMDLRAHADSFSEALEELKDLVEMQISFALERGEPGMIWHPADDVWIEKWNQARREWFSELGTEHVSDSEYKTGSIVRDMPPAGVTSGGTEYTRVDV